MLRVTTEKLTTGHLRTTTTSPRPSSEPKHSLTPSSSQNTADLIIIQGFWGFGFCMKNTTLTETFIRLEKGAKVATILMQEINSIGARGVLPVKVATGNFPLESALGQDSTEIVWLSLSSATVTTQVHLVYLFCTQWASDVVPFNGSSVAPAPSRREHIHAQRHQQLAILEGHRALDGA